jgi:inorganic pyrophosphatase
VYGKNLTQLSAYDSESNELNTIIETPKGSRNKFKYDEKLGLFELGGVMPTGAFFPFDFGFVPSTLGGDGDPLDVLVLMDEPAFPGCLVRSRLIGLIEAEQTEEGETVRNDRLIAVAANSRRHGSVKTLASLDQVLLEEIEHFFVSYNEIKGKLFTPLGRFGPERARKVVEDGLKNPRLRKTGSRPGSKRSPKQTPKTKKR